MPRKNGLCFSFVLCLGILALLDSAGPKEKEGLKVSPATPIPTSTPTPMPTPSTELSALLLSHQLGLWAVQRKGPGKEVSFLI